MKLRYPKDIILKDGSTLQSRFDYGNLDLRGEDLSYARLVGANLNCANLNRANLIHSNLNRANLNCANLNHANLIHASLVGARLVGASLDGTTLEGAILDRASLVNANLNRANLNCANLNRANLSHSNLNHANLSHSNLSHAILIHASLIHASLVGANLDGAVCGFKGITAKIWFPFSGLYRYITVPMITDDGTQYVRMGCYVRKRTEWKKDFWNNESEFPNDGSLESMRRLWAFEFACKWLDAKAKEVNVLKALNFDTWRVIIAPNADGRRNE